MFQNIKLIIGLALILFCSCTNEKKIKEEKTKSIVNNNINKMQLIENDSVFFYLDPQTVATSPSVQYYNRTLSLLSIFENTIVFFDYKTKKIINKIHINNKGADYLGPIEYLGHHVINKDSIVIINPNSQTIFLIDNSGKVILRKFIPANPQDFTKINEGISSSTLEHTIYHDGKIYVHCGLLGRTLSDHTKLNNVLIFDIRSNEIYKRLSRPSSYNIGNWGSNGMMDIMYSTFNPDNEVFVYSFPIDSNIYVTNHKNYHKVFPAASSYFSTVTPMDQNRSKEQDFHKSMLYDYTTSHYYSILYDKYNKLYYRFTLLGNTVEEVNNPGILFDQQASVIILDNTFKKLGETYMPRNKFDFSNMFVGENGLCILRKSKFQLDESKMIYSIFKPITSINGLKIGRICKHDS